MHEMTCIRSRAPRAAPAAGSFFFLVTGGAAPRPGDYWSDFYETKVGHFELSFQLVHALHLLLVSSNSLC